MLGRVSTSLRMPRVEDIRPSKAACRCLFGPVDHEAIQADLRREKELIQDTDEANWNFDFLQVKPRAGRWRWTAVHKDDTSIPRAYDLPGLGGKRKRESEDTDSGSNKSAKLEQSCSSDTALVAASPVRSPSTSSQSESDSDSLDLPSPREHTPSPPSSPTSPSSRSRQSKITDTFNQKKCRSQPDKRH